MVLAGMRVSSARIKPYDHGRPASKRSKRMMFIFVVWAGDEVCDLLYNAPDGLRGRYWQSPDHGSAATRHLIERMLPMLTAFAEQHPPTLPAKVAPMSSEDVLASLQAPSAKIWPREGDWLSADGHPPAALARSRAAYVQWHVAEKPSRRRTGDQGRASGARHDRVLAEERSILPDTPLWLHIAVDASIGGKADKKCPI